MKNRPIYHKQKKMTGQQISNIGACIATNIMQQEKEKIIRNAISAITAACVVTLHDRNGWKKKRLNRFMKQVTEQFMLMKDNFVTVDDFVNWCKEYGIEGVG